VGCVIDHIINYNRKAKRDISMLECKYNISASGLKAYMVSYGLIKWLDEMRPDAADVARGQNLLDQVHDVPIAANTFTLYTKHHEKSWGLSHLIILGLGY
jgi:hypothetical protein